MPSPYWNTQLAPLNQGLGNLAQGLARLPIARAQGAMLGARTGLYNAEADKNANESELTDAKTQEIAKKLAALEDLRNITPAATQALVNGNLEDPSIKSYLGAAAYVTGENSGNIAKALQDNIATLRASGGNLSGAAAVANPDGVYNNNIKVAADANRPISVPSGGTLFTPQGQVLGSGGITLPQGNERLAPQGYLSAGLAGGIPTPDQMEDAMDGGDASQGGQPQTPQIVATMPPKAPAPAKPAPPLQLPKEVLTQMYNYGSTNNPEGTNNPSGGLAAILNAQSQVTGGVGTAPSATKQSIPTINSQEDYDALPPGAKYVDSFGKVGTKSGK